MDRWIEKRNSFFSMMMMMMMTMKTVTNSFPLSTKILWLDMKTEKESDYRNKKQSRIIFFQQIFSIEKTRKKSQILECFLFWFRIYILNHISVVCKAKREKKIVLKATKKTSKDVKKKKIRIDHSVFVFCVCVAWANIILRIDAIQIIIIIVIIVFGGKFKRNDKFYFCFLKLNDYVQARELPDDKLSGDTKIKDNFFFFFFVII